ncbi:MAG: hypothetical protein NXI24_07140 [bacterium]|nr:hypothetical protein [bacterium]
MIRNAAALLMLAGAFNFNCAVLSSERRVLTAALDEHMAPESPVARAAFAPVAMPIGLSALILDGVIINPILHVPDSVDNANFVFEDVPFTGVGEILVFPMRLITYPVIFVGSMLFYAMVPFG